MTGPFPILNSNSGAAAIDPCQHTGCFGYSRLWRPYVVFLMRQARAYVKQHGALAAVGKSFRFVAQRFGPQAKKGVAKPRPAWADQLLDLQVGEWVEVRSEAEIRETLDAQGKTRGLAFVPPEMIPHCGKRYRVYKRVEKIFLEESKQNRKLKSTVLLDGVQCQGIGLDCDRCCYLFWREAWLKRVDGPVAGEEVSR